MGGDELTVSELEDRSKESQPEPGLGLADVVAQLRADLAAAIAQGENERLRFEVGQVELDLSVTVTRSGTAKAGVRFWVVEAGGEGSVSKESVQRLHLTLQPRDVWAAPASDGTLTTVMVDGDEVPGEDRPD